MERNGTALPFIASIVLMMGTVSSSGTSVTFCHTTDRDITTDNHLQRDVTTAGVDYVVASKEEHLGSAQTALLPVSHKT
jgi:hypothetical protein